MSRNLAVTESGLRFGFCAHAGDGFSVGRREAGGVKLVLNALSTCTMVRLGRVMGNTMIWVVPSNLKLIDRATRYIQSSRT